jgi:hypothetical protein
METVGFSETSVGSNQPIRYDILHLPWEWEGAIVSDVDRYVIIIQPTRFCIVWVWNLVSDIKGGTQTEGVEENIWTEERWSEGRLEKTA